MPATPAGRGTQIELQRRDGSPVGRFKCSRCVIEYTSVEPKPDCPLCAQELKTEQMRQALQNLTARCEILEKQNQEMDSRTNLQTAIRSATDLLNEEDRLFLKRVLYQWRSDRSVSLKIIHTGTGSSRRATGFIAEWRGAEAEGHGCTSIGGAAIAACYEEALHTVGSAAAMGVLLRSAQHLLPGEMP